MRKSAEQLEQDMIYNAIASTTPGPSNSNEMRDKNSGEIPPPSSPTIRTSRQAQDSIAGQRQISDQLHPRFEIGSKSLTDGAAQELANQLNRRAADRQELTDQMNVGERWISPNLLYQDNYDTLHQPHREPRQGPASHRGVGAADSAARRRSLQTRRESRRSQRHRRGGVQRTRQ